MKIVSHGPNRRGFTLIELLMVIAIIALLAAIVLASLSSSKGKANAARVEGQMNEMRNAAELYYSLHNNSYGSIFPVTGSCTTAGSMFTDVTTNMAQIITNTQKLVGGSSFMDCGATASTWSVAAILPGNTGSGHPNYIFCVDSVGSARTKSFTGSSDYKNLTTNPAEAHNGAGGTVCQ